MTESTKSRVSIDFLVASCANFGFKQMKHPQTNETSSPKSLKFETISNPPFYLLFSKNPHVFLPKKLPIFSGIQSKVPTMFLHLITTFGPQAFVAGTHQVLGYFFSSKFSIRNFFAPTIFGPFGGFVSKGEGRFGWTWLLVDEHFSVGFTPYPRGLPVTSCNG